MHRAFILVLFAVLVTGFVQFYLDMRQKSGRVCVDMKRDIYNPACIVKKIEKYNKENGHG